MSEQILKSDTCPSPEKPLSFSGIDGYETYVIDNNTIGVRPKWISVKDQPAPKEGKFLFQYRHGIGLGEYGQCYTVIHGNSERTHDGYILILWPSEILDGQDAMTFTEEQMILHKMKWMSLPTPPEEKCE